MSQEPKPKGYRLTLHALERLRERFPIKDKKPTEVTYSDAYGLLASATEEKSFLNNTAFITRIGDKYGYDAKQTYFASGNMLFVGLSDADNGNRIVTVIDKTTSPNPHLRGSTIKYKKKSDE